MSDTEAWIVVRKWDEFQHYKDRWVPWIKFYLELQHDEGWLQLPIGRRGMLASLWLEYAQSRCRLPADTRELSRRFNARFRQDDLDALIQAGFIEVSSRPNLEHVKMASRPTRARKEKEEEKQEQKQPPPPLTPLPDLEPDGGEPEFDKAQVEEVLDGTRQLLRDL